jgi:hypothetical protein
MTARTRARDIERNTLPNGKCNPITGCSVVKTLELGCFFDGTGNNRFRDTDCPSNVARMWSLYSTAPEAPADERLPLIERDKRYVIGLGAGTAPEDPWQPTIGCDESRDAAVGNGARVRCKQMYQWVKARIKQFAEKAAPQSQVYIDVYGFSRGAAEARTFVNLVVQGLRVHEEPNNIMGRVRVRFLGIFDTVLSMFTIGEGQNLGLAAGDFMFARHFTARDEKRLLFNLTPLGVPRSVLPDGRVAVAEVAYHGVHSDVGGGYPPGYENRPNWLAYVALLDMVNASKDAGVEMGDAPPPPGSTVDAMRSRSGAERFIHHSELLRQDDGRGHITNNPVAIPRDGARGIEPHPKLRLNNVAARRQGVEIWWWWAPPSPWGENYTPVPDFSRADLGQVPAFVRDNVLNAVKAR